MRALVALAAAGVGFLCARAVDAASCDGDDERDVCREREIFLMPGVVGTAFRPAAFDEPFVGAGVQLSPLIWTHNNDNFGPGQGTLFFQASMLTSRSSRSTLGLFEAGTTLSLEKNSSRRFGIPYFGFAFGGLAHDELPKSSYAHALLGAHLYFHHNVMLDLQGGYHFPFQDLDVLRGPRAQLTVRFSMW